MKGWAKEIQSSEEVQCKKIVINFMPSETESDSAWIGNSIDGVFYLPTEKDRR